VTNHTRIAPNDQNRIHWLPGTAAQQGAISIALSAATWGIFWIPFRFLDESGLPGLWAVVVVMSAVSMAAIIALAKNKALHTLSSAKPWLIGSALGSSIVLYFAGIIVSDVIRVVFLFYLLPIWTTIAARLVYQEPITPSRLIIIVFALAGLWLLLGGGTELPLPSNMGSLALIRGTEDTRATAMVCTTSVGATLMATITAFALLSLGNLELAAAPSVSVFFDWHGTEYHFNVRGHCYFAGSDYRYSHSIQAGNTIARL